MDAIQLTQPEELALHEADPLGAYDVVGSAPLPLHHGGDGGAGPSQPEVGPLARPGPAQVGGCWNGGRWGRQVGAA